LTVNKIALTALCVLFGAGLYVWPVAAQESAAEPATSLKTDDEKTVYALGHVVGGNLSSFNLSDAELEIMLDGIREAVKGRKPQINLKEYTPKITSFAQKRKADGLSMEKAEGAKLLEAEAAKPGAVKTESGLVYIETKAGEGASPKASDTVKVHYHGMLRDGTVFDSSVDRGEPATFPLGRVIPAWTEGLQKMKVGGKARLVCPAELAYKDDGRPGIPGGAVLIFEVELIEINPGK